MAGPDVEADQQPDTQPRPGRADHWLVAEVERGGEREHQDAGDQPQRQVPVQERQRDDEREQDHDVAAVEGADRRPFHPHPPEVEQGTQADQGDTYQNHTELGSGLLEERYRLTYLGHVMLPRARAAWRMLFRASHFESGAARWPGPGRPAPRRGGGALQPRRSR